MPSHQLGGGVLFFKSYDALAVKRAQGRKGRVIGVDAEGVIERLKKRPDGILDDFEITDHFIGVEICGFEYEFDAAGVTVRKAAGVRVFGQHVTVLDVDGFADAVGHESQVPRVWPKRWTWTRGQKR